MTDVERLVYRVPEVCEILSISKGKAWRMIASGEMPAVRWGKTVRVPKWWVDDILRRRAA